MKDLSVFIFIHPFLINMHNKYFWISTLLGVPRWESVMRIYNLVESIYYSIFAAYKHCHKDRSSTMPTHWAKHLHLKGCVCKYSVCTVFVCCKYSRLWTEKETAERENNADDNNADDQLSEELEMMLRTPKKQSTYLTGRYALQYWDYRVIWKYVQFCF